MKCGMNQVRPSDLFGRFKWPFQAYEIGVVIWNNYSTGHEMHTVPIIDVLMY